jgi:hypothetical protein
MYTRALLGDYADRAELVGYCDVNQTRMDHWNAHYAHALSTRPVPTFKAEQFDQMLRGQRVDCVIVTSIDRTHHDYITRALRLGCDAITEKPMTIDAPKCQQILDTVRSTGSREDVVSEPTRIIVRPHWAKPYLAEVPAGESGHGGGDKRLLSDIFGDPARRAPDPLGQRADHVAGARSILVGIAANESMQTLRPVAVDELVRL